MGMLLVGGQNAFAAPVCTLVAPVSVATLVMPSKITIPLDIKPSYGIRPLHTAYIELPATGENICPRPQGVGVALAGAFLNPKEWVGGVSFGYGYPTNISGIGVNIYLLYTDFGSTMNQPILPFGLSAPVSWSGAINSVRDVRLYVEFHFTKGFVFSGTLRLPSPLVGVYFVKAGSRSLQDAVLVGKLLVSGETQIIAPACIVDANDKNIRVEMPPVVVHTLKNVGDSAGNTLFNVRLRCPSNASVAYQIDGQAFGDPTQGIFPNPTNTGAGIQLLAGQGASATPVHIGNPSATVFTTIFPDQHVSISFTARYLRVGPMHPGVMSARATFTILYN